MESFRKGSKQVPRVRRECRRSGFSSVDYLRPATATAPISKRQAQRFPKPLRAILSCILQYLFVLKFKHFLTSHPPFSSAISHPVVRSSVGNRVGKGCRRNRGVRQQRAVADRGCPLLPNADVPRAWPRSRTSRDSCRASALGGASGHYSTINDRARFNRGTYPSGTSGTEWSRRPRAHQAMPPIFLVVPIIAQPYALGGLFSLAAGS